MAVDKQQHLNQVLETHRMAHINDLLDKYKKKRAEVKEVLEEKYKENIYSPINSGSYAKHTAINIKFDLDIVTPFKRNSFSTLEEMFDDVYEFLKEKYKNEATIRKQKVSIGIEFNEDKDGHIIKIDVVPGRELNDKQYLDDNYLNLFVNSKYGLLNEKTYVQTNIQAQIDHIKGKGDERSIIRLLKIWKATNNEFYKSFFMELVTIKAFDKESISGNLWEKLKSVMEYIRDNVTKDNFTLKDPGNSNNDVADTLDSWERTNLSNKMSNMIDNIERNSENIKTYFPINEDFEEESKSENKYGLKDASIIAPSIPSKSQQFG
ncbi:MAG: nucleotidyltransferase [Bacteroidetes bacterium]|nr:nucleotidyltransferase [Bacteroidota bacterium]